MQVMKMVKVSDVFAEPLEIDTDAYAKEHPEITDPVSLGVMAAIDAVYNRMKEKAEYKY